MACSTDAACATALETPGAACVKQMASAAAPTAPPPYARGPAKLSGRHRGRAPQTWGGGEEGATVAREAGLGPKRRRRLRGIEPARAAIPKGVWAITVYFWDMTCARLAMQCEISSLSAKVAVVRANQRSRGLPTGEPPASCVSDSRTTRCCAITSRRRPSSAGSAMSRSSPGRSTSEKRMAGHTPAIGPSLVPTTSG